DVGSVDIRDPGRKLVHEDPGTITGKSHIAGVSSCACREPARRTVRKTAGSEDYCPPPTRGYRACPTASAASLPAQNRHTLHEQRVLVSLRELCDRDNERRFVSLRSLNARALRQAQGPMGVAARGPSTGSGPKSGRENRPAPGQSKTLAM